MWRLPHRLRPDSRPLWTRSLLHGDPEREVRMPRLQLAAAGKTGARRRLGAVEPREQIVARGKQRARVADERRRQRGSSATGSAVTSAALRPARPVPGHEHRQTALVRGRLDAAGRLPGRAGGATESPDAGP